jgi:PPOX class probable F420-dependent enzyme
MSHSLRPMSRRAEIRLSAAEVEAFLQKPHHLQVATIGRDGRPHLVAMWYGFLGSRPALWTYGRSQKVVNLRRDPRITCLAEAGRDYDELKGVELFGTVTILEDQEAVLAAGRSVFDRYMGPFTEADRPRLERMSAKRVAVRIDVERVVSWDHAKLGQG